MLSRNVKLIDFDLFYREKIHNTIMDSIYAFNLFVDGKIDLKKRPVKQLFINLVTYFIFKHEPADPLIKEVFVIFPNILRDDVVSNNPYIQICEYVDITSLRKCLTPLVKSLSRSHPDLIFLGKRDTLLTNPDLITQVYYSANKFKV